MLFARTGTYLRKSLHHGYRSRQNRIINFNYGTKKLLLKVYLKKSHHPENKEILRRHTSLFHKFSIHRAQDIDQQSLPYPSTACSCSIKTSRSWLRFFALKIVFLKLSWLTETLLQFIKSLLKKSASDMSGV